MSKYQVEKSLRELQAFADEVNKGLTDEGLKAFYHAKRAAPAIGSEAAQATRAMSQKGRKVTGITRASFGSPSATNTRREVGTLHPLGNTDPGEHFMKPTRGKAKGTTFDWHNQVTRMAADKDPQIAARAKTQQRRMNLGAQRREAVRTGEQPRKVPLAPYQTPSRFGLNTPNVKQPVTREVNGQRRTSLEAPKRAGW